jgi:hypothetical protein
MIGPIDCVEYIGAEQNWRGFEFMRFKVVNSSDPLRCGLTFGIPAFTADRLSVFASTHHCLHELSKCRDEWSLRIWLTSKPPLRCTWSERRGRREGNTYAVPHFFLGESPK